MRIGLFLVFTGLIGAACAAGAIAQPLPAAAFASSLTLDVSKLKLASANALVLDAKAGQPIYAKGANTITPIASVTKLMTAMVVLDADQPLDETISVGIGDLDLIKGSHSRLGLGSELPRREMLRLALMASENRAASALARHYPGGTEACVEAMNRKAQSLGMRNTRFGDPTGLSSNNVSDLIRDATTTPSHFVEVQPTGKILGFNNTNSLVRAGQWDIQISKTGFIREAGKCLVMLANITSRPVVIVLLDSYGRLTRIADANRVKHWLETGESMPEAKPVKAKRFRGSMPPSAVRAPAKAKTRA